jgi:hypothetical protein
VREWAVQQLLLLHPDRPQGREEHAAQRPRRELRKPGPQPPLIPAELTSLLLRRLTAEILEHLVLSTPYLVVPCNPIFSFPPFPSLPFLLNLPSRWTAAVTAQTNNPTGHTACCLALTTAASPSNSAAQRSFACCPTSSPANARN